MRTKDYRILTIDGSKLIKEHNKVIENPNEKGKYEIVFDLDFSKDELGRKFDADVLIDENIEEKNEYNENALTYQIRQVLLNDKNIPAEKIRSEMTRTLVYVDFNSLFKYSIGKKKNNKSENEEMGLPNTTFGYSKKDLNKPSDLLVLKFLFDHTHNGFDIKYDNEVRHYTPFDKSNSMSKECKISFIDESVRTTVNERLQLGLNFKNLNMNPSKYFSYRGLYMSDAMRIEQNADFDLNEETVVVIKDDAHTPLKNTLVITNSDNYEEIGWRKYLVKDEKRTAVVFDGEGLISPKYIKLINAQLRANHNKKGTATSIQIRLPFSKGVLHEVDFNGYFKNELDVSVVKMKDYFGIERDLSKAHIIMTSGMFKIAKNLKKIFKDSNTDPMKYYFDKIKEYDHSLYVCNTFENFGKEKFIEMNYQFLNGLDLSAEEFKELIKKSIENSETILKNKYIDKHDYNAEIQKDGDVYLEALERNKKFLNTSRIKSYIKNDIRKSINNIYDGRLYVSGEQRVFSRDLLSLLVYIVRESTNVSEEVKAKNKAIQKKNTIFQTKFYMPESKQGLKLDHGSYYAFFRSPHLSRNEECLLSARVPNEEFELIKKYFGHLTSIVMVGRDAIAPEVLGGADFDGDEVKIVTEDLIVNAVKKIYKEEQNPAFKPKKKKIGGTYTELEKGTKNDPGSEKELVYTKRSLDWPVAKITDFKDSREDKPADKEDKEYSDTIPFEVVVNTFANKIGEISNLAIHLSRKAYKKGGDKELCAKCTIVTGLEIDAGKTGKHPTEYIKNLNEGSNSSNDYYIKTNKKIDEIIGEMQKNPWSNIKVDGNDKDGYKISWEQTYKKAENPVEIKSSSKVTQPKNNINIDILPTEYAKYILENSTENQDTKYNELKGDVDTPDYYFDFETVENWKKKLDTEKLAKTKAIINAYNGVSKNIIKLERAKNYNDKLQDNLDYEKSICNIFKKQYGIYLKTEKYNQLLKDFKHLDAKLETYFGSDDSDSLAQEAYKKYFECKWAYTVDSDKETKLKEILGGDAKLEESDKKLLFNFDNGGNKILMFLLAHYYYISKMEDRLSKVEDDIFEEKESVSEEELAQKQSFYDIYQNYDIEKEDVIIKDKLQDALQKKLSALFDFDYDEELKYVWASNQNIISKIFDNEQIINHVYVKENSENVE